jgi:hypothetical protein
MVNGLLKIGFTLTFSVFLSISGFSQVFFEESVLEGYGKALVGLKEKSKNSKNSKNPKPKKLHSPKLKKSHPKESDLSLAIFLLPLRQLTSQRHNLYFKDLFGYTSC